MPKQTTLEVTVRGLKELDIALKQVPQKIAANHARAGLRAAGNVFRRAARDNIDRNQSIDSGDLRKNIKVGAQMRYGKPQGYVRAKMWYAHFVENGVAAHIIRARGERLLPFGRRGRREVDHPGQAAKPFLRPALDANVKQATEAFRDAVAKRLVKGGIDLPDLEPDGED